MMKTCTLISLSSLRRDTPLRKLTLSLLLPGMLFVTGPVQANPTGGTVIHGNVSFHQPGAGHLQINQSSQQAIIDWADFSIDPGELTQFIQPGSQAAVLNRVTGGDPSSILGSLQANGNVFVINPNGILVGPGGSIDVHGLVLSTLDLDNGEFLAGGDLVFKGGGDGGVTNLGRIHAIGGDVFLIGKTVNNSGTISATRGTVGLAAGEEVLLKADTGTLGERVFVRTAGTSGAGILNDGSIEGAAVELKAHGNVYAMAINNKGSVRALGANHSGGRVFLTGTGGSVANSGSIHASGPGAGNSAQILIQAAYAKVDGMIRAEGGSVQVKATDLAEVGAGIDVSSPVGNGGSVTVEGTNVTLGSTARIDASGAGEGGRILIGGGLQGRDSTLLNADFTTVESGATLLADSTGEGRGGSIVVWSDRDTLFGGELSAKGDGGGGFAEISGRENLLIDGSTIDLGRGGFLLLDPSNFTVNDAVRNTIRPILNSGTDVVIFTNGGDTSPGNGDIIFSSDFSGINAIDGDLDSPVTGSLSLLAYGDIFLRRDLVNNGTGNVNIVAGWDGTTPASFGPASTGSNLSGLPAVLMDDQIFSNTSTYGNRNGSVYIGLETDKATPTNVSTITVGSRNGETNVAGYDLVMVGDNTPSATVGDNRWVQLGYRPSDVDLATLGREAATGRIKVNVLNDITLTAGTKTNLTGSPSGTPGQYNFVQIGHGGRDAADNGFNHSGNILVQAGLGSDPGITGDIIGTAGANLGTFIHIGHGGHGGGVNSGSFSGHITVVAGTAGRIEMTAGTGRRAFTQIGHGGFDVDAGLGDGYHSGDITVRAGTDVMFRGGNGQTQFATDGYAYSMIGHGGALSSATSAVRGHNGAITVQAGSGGVSGEILFKAGDIDDNFVQLGHGGRSSTSATGADGHSGGIDVDAIGPITFMAGTGQAFRGGQDGRMYAQLGHGGFDSATNANVVADPPGSGLGHHGLIEVTSVLGDIVFSGGNTALGSVGEGFGRIHYAQLGHGGYSVEGDHWGSITVEATNGSIRFTGGATEDDATDGIRNSAQLGHGGYFSRGDHGRDGDVISVTAGSDIVFTAGGGTTTSGPLRSFAQLGNGGYDADNPTALVLGDIGNRGEIRVTSTGGNISFLGGPSSEGYSQLGHGGFATSGDHSGALSVGALAGSISFTGGDATDTYVQLGHGGRSASGDHGGVGSTISVSASGDITFMGGNATQAYAMLGHGGRDADNPNPAYYPDNDPLTTVRGPSAAERAGNSGDITVTSTGGSILFTAGSANETWVNLGHGGAFTDGDHTGSITVSANQDILFDATNATGGTHYAQLGHGGHLASGGHTGEISTTAGGEIRFLAGTGSSYVQLGHGGRNDHRVNRGGTSPNFVQNNANDRYYPGTHSGSISVSAGGDITFSGGMTTGGGAYAQIGHGGYRNAAESGEGHNGEISVIGGGTLAFSGGTGVQNYAMIGHGGHEAYGNHGYRVVRNEVGDVNASQGNGSFIAANGSLAPGSVRFTIGTASYVDDANGNLTDPGDVLGLGVGAVVGTIDYSTGEVTFTANANAASDPVSVAYLHGGSDITVQAQNGIAFSAGTAGQTFAQIGHGGFDSDFSTTRNVQPEEPTAPSNNTGATTFHLNTPLAIALGNSGDIVVRSGFDGINVTNTNAAVAFSAGSGADAFVQIGNGGRATDGDHAGNITIDATGDIVFSGGSHQRTFAQIGNGGHDSDANILTPTRGNTGEIRINNALVNAATNAVGSVSFLGGSGEESYAQLGHGGYANRGANSGLIDLRSAGDITFTSGDGSGIGDLDGTAAAFTPTLGHGRRSYAQLGHGGYDADAADTGGTDGVGHSGDLLIRSGGNVSFTSSVVTDPVAEDYRNYVQLGHGGLAANGDHNGRIDLDAAGNITFTAGGIRASDPLGAPLAFFSQDAYAQLGHGGRESDGYGSGDTSANGGDIRVQSGGAIRFASFNPGTLGDAVSVNEGFAQLGHGGYLVDGSHSGRIDVAALGGAISFDASAGANDGYVQLGHGGRQGRGDHSGDMLIDALGDISFLGGASLRNYGQLGHGGWDADFLTGASNNVGNSGDILVNTRNGLVTNAGGLFFTAGAGEESYVKLGHGGHGTQGVHTGNLLGANIIDVRAFGDITFTSGDGSGTGDDGGLSTGNGRRSWAQLGHGGYDSDASNVADADGVGHFSDINVQAGGAIQFTARDLTDPLANDYRNYVQLGHGGLAASGDHRGSISVTAGNGIAFTAGGAIASDPIGAPVTFLSQDAYAQIGHGGYIADGYGGNDTRAFDGNIRVTTTGGDIVFNGSHATEAYVQIGHGGRDSDGGARGTVSVSALSGTVSFQAGTATDNYAQIGHGGRTGRGDREGTIEVLAQGDVTIRGGSGARTYAQIGHGGHDSDNPNNAISGTPDDTTGNSGAIRVGSTSGSVVINAGTGAGGDIYAQIGHGGMNTEGDHSGSILVRAAQHISALSNTGTGANGYVQIGHGGVNGVGSHSGSITASAGTDGAFEDLFDLDGDGSVGTPSDSLTFVNGGLGGIDFRSGAGTNRYAQLGHGGYQTVTATTNRSGGITATSLENILFQGNSGTRSYAQLGHGGFGVTGNNSDDILARSTAGSINFQWAATNSGAGTDSYVKLGHGGTNAVGDHTGAISALAEGNLLFRSTTGGTASNNYAQLGHGGIGASGTHDGGITALANSGSAQFRSGSSTTVGSGVNRYALLGHGGTDATGEFTGDISLISNTAITFTNLGSVAATSNYTQLGHGGLNAASTVGHSGDITVQSRTSSLTFTGGPGGSTDSYAQLGHGGINATGSHSGDIAVSSGTAVSFTGGAGGIQSYAQLGHGGHGADALVGEGHSGRIGVGAGTNLLFTAGNGSSQESYAQLGHGGLGADGNHGGDIVARAGNTLIFTGTLGTDTLTDDPIDPINNPQIRTENRGYAQLGHGGYDSSGDRSGDITASSQLTGDFTDIGDFDGDGFFDTISFNGGSTGTNPFSFLAGENAGTDAASDAYAQLGHGGRLAAGTNTGDIFVDAERTIRFEAGGLGARTYAQLGHGGHDAAPVIDGLNPIGLANDGDISVQSRTGSVNFLWGATNTPTSSEAYVQLGHGGFLSDPLLSGSDAGGHNTGDIKVLAASNILFRSTDDATTGSHSNYAQLGHGGLRWRGNHSGDIAAYAGTDGLSGTVSFNAPNLATTAAGVSANRYVQLGHGGFQARGDHSGDISLLSFGNILFRGGRTDGSYAHLGHGGLDADDDNTALGNTGDIRVASQTGNINFQWNGAGDTPAANTYVQLGHGGFQTAGDHSGDMTVRAGGLIQFRGSTGNTAPANGVTGNYAQLGHGGFEAAGNHGGDITVSAGIGGLFDDVFDLDMNGTFGEIADDVSFTSSGAGTITFLSGGSQADRYAQLGHGGTAARGDHGGNIDVTALGNITFTAGTGARGYAMIGHGGHDADSHDPAYYPDNDPLNPLRGPSAAERIGNTGDIRVETTDGSILFTTGNGTGSNFSAVQIGHGGTFTDGDHVGSITVIADTDRSNAGVGGEITFRANTQAGTHSARIGHGGFEASGGHTGDIAVTAGGSIAFTGGGTNNAVQIGHGGVNDHRVTRTGGTGAFVQTNNNDLYYAGTHSGAVVVNANSDITFTGGSGTAAFAQVGHGGYRNAALAGEGHNGDISVVGGGLIHFTSLNGTSGFVQIGHGGYESFGNHGYKADGSGSDILVDGGAGISFTAGSGSTNYAQIGHGGVSSAFSSTLNIDPEEDAPAINTSTTTYHLNTPSIDPVGMSGNITVFAGTGATTNGTAAITFASGAGNDAYAQIGNGGRAARGDHSGHIEVSAANGIDFTAFDGGVASQTVNNNGTLNNLLQNDGAANYTMAQTGNLERGTIVITYDNPAINPITGLSYSGTIRSDAFGRLFDDDGTPVGTVTTGGVVDLTVTVSDSVAGPANSSMTFDHFNTGLRSYVQIGNGGSEADFPVAVVPGSTGNLGNISVTTRDGAISFAAGSRSEAYAQIGNGGYATDGNHSGHIVVEALGTGGAINFAGGSRVETYAQIGHGGRSAKGEHGRDDVDGDGNADGNITARAAGSIQFSSGSAGQAYAQIGHGGYDADAVTDPFHPSNRGEILVESTGGDIAFSAAGSVGNNAYAQIGHGGMINNGDFSGDITVRALGGAISFTGGEATDRYAQLGHGGRAARGDHQGEIEVFALGDVSFSGGSVSSIAGESSAALTDAAINGAGATLANTANLDRATLVITVANPLRPEYATLTTTATGEILDGNGIQVGTAATNGAVAFSTPVANPGTAPVTFAYQHINYSRSYAQIGHGGHDADNPNPTYHPDNDPLNPLRGPAAAERVGNAGNIAVTSSGGDVLFSVGLSTDSYVQIGHGGSVTDGDHRDNITVNAFGDILFDASAPTGSNQYAQLGHGGHLASGGHTGNVVANAGGRIGFTAGTGGSYVQIGHGGRNDHRVTRSGASPNFAQNNVNDRFFPGTHSGSIGVSAGTDITFASGTGTAAFAQIGHGGFRNAALAGEGHTGDVSVIGGGAITFTAGSGAQTYTQIGHGGYEAFGNHGLSASSDVFVDGGAGVSFAAGSGANAYAQIGNGGFDSAFSTTRNLRQEEPSPASYTTTTTYHLNTPEANALGAGGNVTVYAGTGATASADASVSMTAGNGTDSYVQIGNGGRLTTGSHGGDIVVDATGDVTLNAFTGAPDTTQTVNNGTLNNLLLNDTAANYNTNNPNILGTTITITYDNPIAGFSGVITDNGSGQLFDNGIQVGTISATGVINLSRTVSSGTPNSVVTFEHLNNGLRSYAQIGNGGHAAGGNHSGNLSVVARDTDASIALTGGNRGDTYAQIGHGGILANGSMSGSVHLDATGDLNLTGGVQGYNGYALVGHGGVGTGFLPTNENFTTGTRSGDMLIRVGGETSLDDQNSLSFIGHLGTAGIAPGSRLSMVSGTYDLSANSRGLGGVARNFLPAGNVDIGASAGDLVFAARDNLYTSANSLELFATGDIRFTTSLLNGGAGDLSLIAGWDGATGLDVALDPARMVRFSAFEFDATPILAGAGLPGGGDILVGGSTSTLASVVGTAGGTLRAAAGSISVRGSDTITDGYAQLGFNEERFRMLGGVDGIPATGSIDLRTGVGGLALEGGNASGASAQVGHGGPNTTSPLMEGDISVDLGVGALDLRGGGGHSSIAMMGHGGIRSRSEKSGSITIGASEATLAGGSGAGASARIGHGGLRGSGSITGDLSLDMDGDIRLLAGSGQSSTSQIGFAGDAYDGAVTNATLQLRAGGDIALVGGDGFASAATIGHGAFNEPSDPLGGDIFVDAEGDIVVRGGSNTLAFAQIGHGGVVSSDMNGNLTVRAGNEVVLEAANGNIRAYSKIGHGDDLTGSENVNSGDGTRSGDILLTAGSSIHMTDAMIGHRNTGSNATDTSSETVIATSRNDPADPAAGFLVADPESEFSGGTSVRLYTPQRASNQIAAGALINGISYAGTPVDPTAGRLANEFTIFITGDFNSAPAEHSNAPGSGPGPVTGGFAFYYDTIALRASGNPLPVPVPIPGGGNGTPQNDETLREILASLGARDDEFSRNLRFSLDDELVHEVTTTRRRIRRTKPFNIYYSGFSQYATNGESIFTYTFNAAPGIPPLTSPVVVPAVPQP